MLASKYSGSETKKAFGKAREESDKNKQLTKNKELQRYIRLERMRKKLHGTFVK